VKEGGSKTIAARRTGLGGDRWRKKNPEGTPVKVPFVFVGGVLTWSPGGWEV